MTDLIMTIYLAKSSLSERTRDREKLRIESRIRKTNKICLLSKGRKWWKSGLTN